MFHHLGFLFPRLHRVDLLAGPWRRLQEVLSAGAQNFCGAIGCLACSVVQVEVSSNQPQDRQPPCGVPDAAGFQYCKLPIEGDPLLWERRFGARAAPVRSTRGPQPRIPQRQRQAGGYWHRRGHTVEEDPQRANLAQARSLQADRLEKDGPRVAGDDTLLEVNGF